MPKCGDGACEMPFEATLTCPADCGEPCGDGKCVSPLENPFTCAKDCPAPKCGDAACTDPWETTVTCPADCKPGGGAISGNLTTCVASKCGKESIACLGDFMGCGSASLCFGSCKDMNCVDACGAKLSGGSATKFKALRDCIGTGCTGP